MLYFLRSNTIYIESKIKILNRSRKQPAPHISGYQAGFSPKTNFLPIIDSDLNIHRIERRENVHTQGLLHPTVHLMIFSPDMRYLLVQRRSSKKDFSGGKLSTSVAGHIGGSSKIVGQRISLELAKATLNDEVFEEAGLTELEYWFISRFAYQSHSLTDHISGKPIYANQEQVLLFYSKYKGSISPNLTEVDWMDWFSVKGIQKLTKQKPELFAPSFLKDLEVFTNRQIR